MEERQWVTPKKLSNPAAALAEVKSKVPFCIHYTKQMKKEIFDSISGGTAKVSMAMRRSSHISRRSVMSSLIAC